VGRAREAVQEKIAEIAVGASVAVAAVRGIAVRDIKRFKLAANSIYGLDIGSIGAIGILLTAAPISAAALDI
jgi:hypothetical protein